MTLELPTTPGQKWWFNNICREYALNVGDFNFRYLFFEIFN